MIANALAREMYDYVKASGMSKIAFIDAAVLGVPADDVAGHDLRRRSYESRGGIASSVECRDKGTTNETGRTSYTDAHAKSHRWRINSAT